MWIQDILDWLKINPTINLFLIIIGILILCYLSYLVTKRILIKGMGVLVSKTKTKYDDIIFEKILAKKLPFIPPILIIANFTYLVPRFRPVLERLSYSLLLLILLSSLVALLNSVNIIYEEKKHFQGRPIKGIIQVASLIIYILGILVIISILAGKSPLIILSGVGALTAVLLLIFRDTILAFVASIQITANDLVRLNDWIEVPKFGADGDVIDIALHTVKVQNFDKTITVIPTHKLIDVTFKNWRGMEETGGRRIKRAIHIDVESIKLCDENMMKKFKKIEVLKSYLNNKQQEIKAYNLEKKIDGSQLINGRRLTNVGTFRAYIEEYLKVHTRIDKTLTFLVRQLAPGPTGLPIEIYVFTNDTRWVNYEDIQADIFDHLLAVVKEFELRVFQYPSGRLMENN